MANLFRLVTIAAIVVVLALAPATITATARRDKWRRAEVNGRHASGTTLAFGLVVFLCLLLSI